MAGPAIRLVIRDAPAPASTRHDCPLCSRISLPGFKAACTPCRKRLPRRSWLTLAATWDEGRGAGSDEYLAALEAAESHLASKGEKS